MAMMLMRDPERPNSIVEIIMPAIPARIAGRRPMTSRRSVNCRMGTNSKGRAGNMSPLVY
jgi:hypothetical protein